jgi:UDP-N-acetylmuramate-alanine ligase
MLAELMRPCATVSIQAHRQTTTTSLIADLLKAADLDPTVIAAASSMRGAPMPSAKASGWWSGHGIRLHVLEASTRSVW